MKLVRYGERGKERAGLIDGAGGLRDLSALIGDIRPDTIGSIAGLRELDEQSLPPIDRDVRLGPCVGGIGKFLCIGLNFADHAAETGQPIPAEPIVFMKATSAVSGPFDDVVIPRNSLKSDWEVELGVVVGRELRYAGEDEAESAIAGYCVVNDLSEREWQLERGGTWDKGKGCDTFGPIGPWLVTPDEIQDSGNLAMWLDVDGHRYQSGSTATMIFKPAYLLSYLSRFMSLQPGDLISTGTPPGVGLGRKPPIFLKAGQEIRLGIAGLGEQRQRTVAWNAAA